MEQKIKFPEKLYMINLFKVLECELCKQTTDLMAVYCVVKCKPFIVLYSLNRKKYLQYCVEDLYKTEKQALNALRKKCIKAIKDIDKKLTKK